MWIDEFSVHGHYEGTASYVPLAPLDCDHMNTFFPGVEGDIINAFSLVCHVNTTGFTWTLYAEKKQIPRFYNIVQKQKHLTANFPSFTHSVKP